MKIIKGIFQISAGIIIGIILNEFINDRIEMPQIFKQQNIELLCSK